MYSLPKFLQKKYRSIAIGLAGIITVSVAIQGFYLNSLTAEARQETLPGIEKLRNEFVDEEKTYRILEIQPNIAAAEVGFYIGGQEPFGSLLQDDNSWISWQEKVASLTTREERVSFMQQLEAEAQEVLSALEGSGQVPFSLSSPFYEEVENVDSSEEAAAAGLSSFEITASIERGYFLAATDDTAKWQVVFEPLNNWNITLDEINNGINTPYYTAVFNADAPLTREQIQQMAEGEGTADYLYQYDGSYLHFAGTAQEVWSSIESDVSAGDSDVTGGDVSLGDANSDLAYYCASFKVINDGTGQNAVTTGAQVYVVNARNVKYVTSGGNYHLVTTAEGVAAGAVYDVEGETIYYRGGITNAEVLRSGILGLDEDEWDKFHVQIDTMTPGMINKLTEEEIQEYDMVYFGTGALENALNNTTYTYTEDFTVNALELIAGYIVRKQIPCIVDSSAILNVGEDLSFSIDGNSTVPNYQKLLGLLLSPDKSKAFTDEGYTSLQADLKNNEMNSNLFDSYFPIADIEQLDGFSQENSVYDGEYVCENVWVYNSKNSLFVKKGFVETVYNDTKVEGGFRAVLEEIQSENEIRRADLNVNTYLSEDITDGTAWRYVLNYQNRRGEVKKSELKVLRIEPACTDTGETTFKTLLSNASGVAMENITIDWMPVTEFIGIIDDLNAEYDLIYIGSLTAGFKSSWDSTQNAEITKFRDSSMNGLVYSHVGDSVMEKTDINGLLDTDVIELSNGQLAMKNASTHRFTGNDITVEKYNALLDYLDASYPIVVANDLLVRDTTVTTDSYVVNEKRIDNSSYLYELLDKVKDRENVFRLSEVSSTNHDFAFYLNRPKLDMQDFILLNTEDYKTDSDVRVIKKNATDGKYYLSCQFTVQNQGAASIDMNYSCKLYLDSNADGKFSTKNEELDGLTVTNSRGQRVDTDQLKAGETYTVTRQIPDNFEGCITWKVVVQQQNNPYIRTNEIGYVRLQKESGETATKIKILQIYFHSNYSSNIVLQDQIGTVVQSEDGVYSYANNTGQSNTYFYKLTREMASEYILDVTSVSRSNFDKFATGQSNTIPGTDISDLSDFNMLIVGFSDAYSGNLSNDWSTQAVEAIKEFADSGRSVLLAHDTTSLVNIPQDMWINGYTKYRNQSGGESSYADWYWGYNMNRLIRDLLGMDIYGVTVSEELQKGEALTSDSEWYRANNNEPMEDGRYQYNFKDLAYMPGSDRQVTVPEVQGFTYPVLQTRYYSADNTRVSYRTSTWFSGNRSQLTQTVTKVNEGQITNYPFEISGDQLEIAYTHNQYYALDLNSDSDNDGQTDLVVWYCLAAGDDNVYAASPNDVRNNYYIFNKGNITYTGMGHNVGVKEGEAKLFLNTMIASYQSGTKSPEVSVLDADGNACDYIYSFYDGQVDQESTVDVYFSMQDMNMVTGTKTMEVEYWIEDNSENGTSEVANSLLMSEITDVQGVVTYDMNGNVVTDVSSMQPNTQYRISIPFEYFEPSETNGNEIVLVIRARTVIDSNRNSGQEEVITAWATGQMRYLNCELFDLD